MKYEIKGSFGHQHKRRMLSGMVSAKDLADMWNNGLIVVDAYSAANPEGYQRKETPTRSKKVAKFVKDESHGVIPTSIIIFSRTSGGGIIEKNGRFYIDSDTLKKEAEEYLKSVKTAASDRTVLYVADGQHRVSGFAEAVNNDYIMANPDDPYDVPVTIIFWEEGENHKDSKMEEARQFFTINTEQKRMKTDLAYKFLFEKHQEESGMLLPTTNVPFGKTRKEYLPYATFVARYMAGDELSPLNGKITPINETRAASGTMISESSLIDSLQPVVRMASERDYKLEEVCEILTNYWNAISDLCPEAFEGNPNDYVLLKTPGIYSLHIVLPVLLQRKTELGNVPTADDFRKVLQGIDEVFMDSFWASKPGEETERGVATTFGAGAKAFGQLAQHIIDEMG